MAGDSIAPIPLPWSEVKESFSFIFFHVTFICFACVFNYNGVMRIEIV